MFSFAVQSLEATKIEHNLSNCIIKHCKILEQVYHTKLLRI